MILLDENIPEDQVSLLKRWRIRARQIGQEVGSQGMKDDEHVRPLLHSLHRPTFFTRDLGFFNQGWIHPKYAIVCLAVSLNEVARFVRLFLRHPSFDSAAKRMGTVARVSSADIRVRNLESREESTVDWLA